MTFLDMRTILFGYLLTDVMCLIVAVLLWRQSRARFEGMSFWVWDFALLTLALILITLRGEISDWFSIILAQAMVMVGAYLGYLGLLKFSGRQAPQIHNYGLLLLQILVNIYFAVIQPNLAVRGLNVAAGLTVFSLQCVWLAFYGAPSGMRELMRGVGLVFTGYCIVNITRIFEFALVYRFETDFLQSGTFDKLVMISYQMLSIMLTYALALMANKRLHRDIAAQEEKFSKAFLASPSAINLTRLCDGVMVEANIGFLNTTGYFPSDVIGKTAIDLNLWADDHDRVLMVRELMDRRTVRDREYQFRKKSGEILTGLFSADIITIHNHECVLSSVTDITERRSHERILQEREAFIRTVMDHLPIGIAVNTLSPSVTFSYMNEKFLQCYRTTRAAIDGPDGFWNAVYEDPEFRESIRSRILADCASGDPERMVWQDIPITRTGEKTTYVASQNTPVPGKDMVISTVWDVTARRLSEEALRESEAFLNRIIDQSPYPMWISDDRGMLIRINPACLKMLNLEAQEVIGKYNIFEDNIVDAQGLMPQVARAFRNGETVRFEISYNTSTLTGLELKGTASVLLDTTLFPIKNREGRLTNVVIQHIEITERKRAQNEIRKLNVDLEQKISLRTKELRDSQAALLNLVDDLNESSQSLEAANQALEAVNKELAAFSYSVSHDLRAPLRSIDGFSAALSEDFGGQLTGDALDYLQRIRRATRTMGQLIDDMLNLSRVTQAELQCSDVNLSRIAQNILDGFQNFNPSRNVDIHVQEDVIVCADDHLMNIALTNLLENAWKFTAKAPSAVIEFGCETRDGKKVIFVRDNGAGFEPQYTGRLFGAFQRLHKSEDYPGTGIGLATVQRIIHRHGGKIWAEGETGKGATFYFTVGE